MYLNYKSIKGRKNFYELFSEPVKGHIIITFLALLELMKKNEVKVEQEK